MAPPLRTVLLSGTLLLLGALLLPAAVLAAPSLAPERSAVEGPVAPSNLRAAPLSPSRIRIAWQDNSCDEIGQMLDIEVGGEWSRVPYWLDPGITSLVVTGLASATPYRFRVLAIGDKYEESFSEAASVRTLERTSSCIAAPDRLCLEQGRFEIKAHFESGAGQSWRPARAVPDSRLGGFFWFFTPQNLELGVEILESPHSASGGGDAEGTALGLRFAGLTDLAYRLEVRDHLAGTLRVFENPPGGLCGFEDRNLFGILPPATLEGPTAEGAEGAEAEIGPTDPNGLGIDVRSPFAGNPILAKASCDRDPRALGLIDGRFEVRLEWTDAGRRDVGMAFDGTDDSGFFLAGTAEDGAAPRQHPDWAVKVLDGRSINGHFWIFSVPLSRLGGTVTVTDISTGVRRQLEHPPGTLCLRAQLSHPR